jgi:hypothetical protein
MPISDSETNKIISGKILFIGAKITRLLVFLNTYYDPTPELTEVYHHPSGLTRRVKTGAKNLVLFLNMV